MVDVAVLCEGQTEREFCAKLIARELWARNVSIWGTLVGKPQRKQGGIRPWPVYRSELLRLSKERPDRHVAVLVDYYAMPDSWPGRVESTASPMGQRGACVETALRNDLAKELPERFHPCVQFHEFESLLFIEPEVSALSIAVGGGAKDFKFVAAEMKKIRDAFGGNVEHINDNPATAPSKRLTALIRGYDKVAWGVTAVADISIERLRTDCAWLDRWLKRLGALAEN